MCLKFLETEVPRTKISTVAFVGLSDDVPLKSLAKEVSQLSKKNGNVIHFLNNMYERYSLSLLLETICQSNGG